MTTEIALLNEYSANKINEMMGFVSTPKPQIPVFKVNGSDDDDGLKAPKGTFVYDDGDRVLYATEAHIRVFFMGYQYRYYAKEKDVKSDASIIAPNFDAEFRSISGKLACGKMSKKKFEALGAAATKEQSDLQKDVKCKLMIFGLVSGTFTDLDSKKQVTLSDALFVWTVSQAGFMGMSNTITGIGKERRAIPSTPIKLTLKKEKNGQVTYYIPIPEVTSKTVKLVESNLEDMEKIKKYIKDTNDHVNSKYNEAHKQSAMNDAFKEVAREERKAAEVIDMPNDPLDMD